MSHAGVFSYTALDESQGAARRRLVSTNFALISSAAASLGGIPAMLTAEDCCASGGPHEHAVVGWGVICHLSSDELIVNQAWHQLEG